MNFFFALIGYFILSTLLLLLFYIYSKQTDKKTRYLKALLSSLLGLIALVILIIVYKFNQDTINFTYGKIKDNYLDGLQGDIFSYRGCCKTKINMQCYESEKLAGYAVDSDFVHTSAAVPALYL